MEQLGRFGKVRAAILIVLGVLLGAYLIEPAIAHLGSFSHLKSHFGVKVVGNTSDSSINDFTSATFTNLISKSFTAPRKGVVHVLGTVGAEDDVTLAGEGLLQYRLRVDGVAVTSDDQAAELSYADRSTEPDSADSGAFAAVVPVSAGGHTVTLQAKEGGDGSFIRSYSVTAIFSPFGSGNTIPVAGAASGAKQNN
jgi:hypothetical protein